MLSSVATAAIRSRLRLALSIRQRRPSALFISLGCGLGRSSLCAIDGPHLSVGAGPARSEHRADNPFAANDRLLRRGVAKAPPGGISEAARCSESLETPEGHEGRQTSQRLSVRFERHHPTMPPARL